MTNIGYGVCLHYSIKLGESNMQTELNEPRHEKTGFSHVRKQSKDQLRGNREADQRLCFRYIGSTIPLLSKSEISSL